MPKSESVLENEMHKILFKIQTELPIPTRRPNLVIISNNKKQKKTKKNLTTGFFIVPADHRVKVKKAKKIYIFFSFLFFSFFLSFFIYLIST